MNARLAMNARLDTRSLPLPSPLAGMQPGRWHASLDLVFSRVNSGTRLTRKQHQGPLYVQKPFYPEGRDLAHVYLLHPPGGLVSGDRLEISVAVEEGAQALVTTPGAGRVYRARTGSAIQHQHNVLRVGEGALLEWFPQEAIVYTDAAACLQTEVHLAPSARYSGWEILSLGLPARQETFSGGSLQQQCRLWQGDRPLLVENMCISGDDREFLDMQSGLQGSPVTGLFIAGPFPADDDTVTLLDSLRSLTNDYRLLDSVRSRGLACVTRVNGFIVCRYLGNCSWQAKHFFSAAWSRIRPVLNRRPACAPRIWST